MALRDDLAGNRDLLIGATGAVVLTLLVVLLFWARGVAPGPGAGGPGGGLAFYDVAFEEETHDLDLGDDESGTAQQGEAVEVDVVVEAANVTRFEVQLQWPEDDVAVLNRDEFSLEVQPPTDAVTCETPNPRTGTSGTLTIVCQGVDVPDPLENLAADSPADARARAADQVPARLEATGTYTVVVTLEDTNDPNEADASNPYSLTVTYTDYHPQATLAEGGPSE